MQLTEQDFLKRFNNNCFCGKKLEKRTFPYKDDYVYICYQDDDHDFEFNCIQHQITTIFFNFNNILGQNKSQLTTLYIEENKWEFFFNFDSNVIIDIEVEKILNMTLEEIRNKVKIITNFS